MKFAHSLILNAVPDWIDQYVHYDHLKKIVYQVERVNVQRSMATHGPDFARTIEEGHFEKLEEHPPSQRTDLTEDDKRFLKELDIQLDKVVKFYRSKESEIFHDARSLRDQYEKLGGTELQDGDTAGFCGDSEHKLECLDSILAGHTSDEYTNSDMDAGSEDEEKEDEDKLKDAKSSPKKFQSNSETNLGHLTRRHTDKKERTRKRFRKPRRSRTYSGIERSRSRRIEAEILNRSPAPVPQQLLRQTLLRMLTTNPMRYFRRGSTPTSVMNSTADIDEFNRMYNFRARCASVYILLAELKGYLNLNRTAFAKITKKWDKVTGSHLQEAYYNKKVLNAYPFQSDRMLELETGMRLVQDMYAMIFTHGDVGAAVGELKLHMRDHIQFERNTVWKDMVGEERKTFDAHAVEAEEFRVKVPFTNLSLKRSHLMRVATLLISVAVYIIFMCIDTLDNKPASKCLALLLFAALMWAFETLPLFATAYLLPLLIVPMNIILDDDGNQLSAAATAKAVFGSMFNGTIMVLLGGFSIAAALSKHGVAKAFASTVLSRAGTKPHWVILVNMYLAAFLCMWISNVATPVLCFSLVQPILRTLPPNSTVGPCLILGIALASCIGGLASPISSPQNIITIQYMTPNPGWGIWFAAALPLGIICIFTTWLMLLLYFRPGRNTPHINAIPAKAPELPSIEQIWVTLVCLATIALWCAETAMDGFWGDNGTIAAIPFVLLFGTNMLSKSDLNNFLWSVVTLAQGGMALGYAVQRSGLLDIIGHRIASGVQDMPVLGILFIFGLLVLVFATFVSHTVAALIIVPIVQQIGQGLQQPHPNLLVMVTGLTSSIAMGLPVSGFPNMNAIMQEDPTGKPYLRMKDFILCGIPSSIIGYVIVILLGYGILSGVGY